ncbi:hypothetical protein O9929_08475 [Vibrio lentus]|nr:hypothetical protein [Vibrio lentus]
MASQVFKQCINFTKTAQGVYLSAAYNCAPAAVTMATKRSSYINAGVWYEYTETAHLRLKQYA